MCTGNITNAYFNLIGVHTAPPPMRQNREVMDMEIDEVQHELNEVEDSQVEDMEVCEIAVSLFLYLITY